MVGIVYSITFLIACTSKVETDCAHITVYNLDEEICNLMKVIVDSEEMFFTKGLEEVSDDNV